MNEYQSWFKAINGFAPHLWQSELANESAPMDRLIRIPTGLGKTLGVLGAWLYLRSNKRGECWPRRLVWCLPMRVLVEQTAHEARQLLAKSNMLWDLKGAHAGRVGVHVLMGGSDDGDWALHPDECAILIGTQDMLLSRALNRGYAASAARWPLEFGLLNHDCLWVMDEVQLMDVGLATSAQLQAFRADDQSKALRPCFTWWMSATLQREWLRSVDTGALVDRLPCLEVPPKQRHEDAWKVKKPCRVAKAADESAIAQLVLEEHKGNPPHEQYGRITIVVLNRVERALSVFEKLKQDAPSGVELRLVHSRFRPHERASWRESFLSRGSCIAETDRIIVATQVVEAGVDISATTLITELSPWPSFVQRAGRAARWGGAAHVVVLDCGLIEEEDEKAALPYLLDELKATREELKKLDDVSLVSLEEHEAGLSENQRAILYPYQPKHLLLRHELNELFDTTPDLTGADIDISRFIRSGEERDLQVFWIDVPKEQKNPEGSVQPVREALCPVPFLKAREWLCGDLKAAKLKKGTRAWSWDWLNGNWRACRREDMLPGRVILVGAECGGYTPSLGWNRKAEATVVAISSQQPPRADLEADNSQNSEKLSENLWKTIGTHNREVAEIASQLAERLAPEHAAILELAGRWHDVGKSHPAFQGSIRHQDRPANQHLAKAPRTAWAKKNLYSFEETGEKRPGFRHELASALALFALLRRHHPAHPALLGPWIETLRASNSEPNLNAADIDLVPTPLEQAVLNLTAPGAFDLLAYLVAGHHGKVRVSLHAAPDDQDYRDRDGRGLPIRGVREGDELPSITLANGEALPKSTLTLEPAHAGLSPLTGASWTERTLGLLKEHGPWRLAFLEALLRVADIRASRLDTPDPLLKKEGQP